MATEEKRTSRLVVRLEPTLHEAALATSERTGVPLAHVMRTALVNFVAQNEK